MKRTKSTCEAKGQVSLVTEAHLCDRQEVRVEVRLDESERTHGVANEQLRLADLCKTGRQVGRSPLRATQDPWVWANRVEGRVKRKEDDLPQRKQTKPVSSDREGARFDQADSLSS